MGFCDFPHDIRHPYRSMAQTSQKLFSVLGGEPLLQLLNYQIINIPPAQMPEGLNHQTTGFPGGGQVARRCPFEQNLQLPDLDPAVNPIRQKNDLHWHLFRKAKQIGGIAARGLQPNGVAGSQRLCHGINGGMERLVLKGGNALNLVLLIGTRASVDIDLSMESDFSPAELEDVRNRLESRLQQVFAPEHYPVFVYTTEMLVAEKLRAICQQMPEYGPVVKRSWPGAARARDFLDIQTLISPCFFQPVSDWFRDNSSSGA